MRRILYWLCLGVFAVFTTLSASSTAMAQAGVVNVDVGDPLPSRDDEAEAQQRARASSVYNLRVGWIRIDARWVGPIQLPLAVGDVLTPEKISEAMNALRTSITTTSSQGFGLKSKGEVGVLYIGVDFETNRPPGAIAGQPSTTNSIGVVFRPFYLHLSLVQIGDNVLPIPRSAKPTFYENVPGPLLALRPTFGASYDRAFGSALGAAIDADLLSLRDPAHPDPARKQDLDLQAQGVKSLDELFYRANVGLNYRVRKVSDAISELRLHADYAGAREPLGDAEHQANGGLFSPGISLKLAPNTRAYFDVAYQRASEEVNGRNLSQDSDLDREANRLIFEAIPPLVYGFVRAGVWQENNWLTGSGGAYQRLVGRIGYAKEIPISQNQTIGLEILAGAGKIWGDAPAFGQFYGGNSPGQFLYDRPTGASLSTMPNGPLLRSFGEMQAGFRRTGGRTGGDSFWHVNVNLALPLPLRGWFYPLIPNELTDLPGADGTSLSIKQVLSRQINVSGPNMLAAALQTEHPEWSAEQAADRARSILSEVRPAADFIINHANLYSIKPLLMFDAAGIDDRRSHASETWLAAGGGVQITLVTANFEIGYMQTLSGPTIGNRGSVFMRLVFQNLF